jgi:hypothetical protein
MNVSAPGKFDSVSLDRGVTASTLFRDYKKCARGKLEEEP